MRIDVASSRRSPMILQAGSRSKGMRIQIEGVFPDLASVFGSTNGDAPPTVLYGVAEHTVRDAVARRRVM